MPATSRNETGRAQATIADADCWRETEASVGVVGIHAVTDNQTREAGLMFKFLSLKEWHMVICVFDIPIPTGPRGNAVDKPVPKWHRMGMVRVTEEPRRRITARVSDSVRDTLEQAAELLGATVNQFVVQTAYVEAQRVIERESVIRLSQKDAHRVLALLGHPPKPNKRLEGRGKNIQGHGARA